jgi:hypothetical protein
MGRSVFDKTERARRAREKAKRNYHERDGNKLHKIRYIIKKWNVDEKELEGMNVDEKLDYLKKIHIQHRFGIVIRSETNDNSELN